MREIPYCRVLCDGNELAYVKEVLESGWLTTAGRTQDLERRFAESVGARYALAVNSCTAALHLAAEALGVGPGDKVFVPTMTFTATAEVVRYLGADPVLLDVEYGTSLVTPSILEDAMLRHPSARVAMIVHFGGQAAQMGTESGRSGLLEVGRRGSVRLIEDAAHAFPARRGGHSVGSIGELTCFSFYANKTMTTAEGGMVTTDDEELANRIRTMRLHGIDRDIWGRFTAVKPSWEYDVVAAGYKYNMPDLNAAVGLAQLERVEERRRGRERCARYYLERLAAIECLDLPNLQVEHAEHAWHIFSIVLNARARIGRDACVAALKERGIGTSVHYRPLHRMTYYQRTYGLRPEEFPEAERTWRGCLSLPLYATLSEEELDYICTALEEILGMD